MQRLHTNCARLKDAQIKLRLEECALSMEQRGSESYAVLKDVQIKLRGEEYALSMVQMSIVNVALEVAQIRYAKREVSAKDTSHNIATPPEDLLRNKYHTIT